MKTLDDLTTELLENPEVRAAYDALAPEFAQIADRYAAGCSTDRAADGAEKSFSQTSRTPAPARLA